MKLLVWCAPILFLITSLLIADPYVSAVPTISFSSSSYSASQSPAYAQHTAMQQFRAGRSRLRSSMPYVQARIPYELLSVDQWMQLARYMEKADEVFLAQAEWYLLDNFVAVAKKFPNYEESVAQHYHNFKKYEHETGWFSSKDKHQLAQRFAALYKEVEKSRDVRMRSFRAQHFNDTFSRTHECCQQEHEIYINNDSLFGPSHILRVDKRTGALADIQAQGIIYSERSYEMSPAAETLISESSLDRAEYTHCYGNQLQQVIHQDCIHLLEESASVPPASPIYEYKGAVVECIDSSREYNKNAECVTALTIQDFCWALLEYGKAVVEGAASGVVSAVKDCIEHPINTAACVIWPQGVLVYQLSKVLMNVADIGITYAFDSARGEKKLRDYLKPLRTIKKALKDKKIKGPDVVRAATEFTVSWKAQNKILRGLSKFYKTTTTKLERFIKKNRRATPEEYMATPEGDLLKCAAEECPLETHPPHCAAQYEALKNALNIEQFTSIIKTTRHGIKRLIERGFTPEEVKVVFHFPDMIRTQRDGAQVFIKKIGKNKYNFMSYNKDEKHVVTALKNINKKDLINLSKNYGWEI